MCRFFDFLLHLLPLPPVEADPSFPSSSHAPCTPVSPPPGSALPRVAHLERALPVAPPPRSASTAAPRAHASPYLTWTNACRQSQEFRPLTSASSAQGTAQETAGRGWGGRRGRAPTSSRSRPAEVSLFVCGFAPGPRSERSRDK